MKLQQATRYAILATVHMAANPGKQVSAYELAAFYELSQHHLAKVLRTLSMAKIVSSTRGPNGGCTFIANPKHVTLYDIIVLFENDWWDTEAESEPSGVAREVSRVLSELDRITMATLRSVTIQTIINNARRSELRDRDSTTIEQRAIERAEAK